MVPLSVNGSSFSVDAERDTPLLWVLRDHLGLTGTKFGCGMALCGACTVFIDGKPARSCATPVSALVGRRVTTVEAVGSLRVGKAVQEAWIAESVPQCGYCQSGQVMSAVALLTSVPAPNDAQIDEAMAGNLCRCATYLRIRAAIKRAARWLAENPPPE
ncbi:MAG TPA: (2Fe-2S)-binding protein [Burkholderiales bacterium]|nr:(2Fe-2S)-binding protein [Burkholderiales bacterium]